VLEQQLLQQLQHRRAAHLQILAAHNQAQARHVASMQMRLMMQRSQPAMER
jgi:uncharacterized protein YdbL (DUF1318 family)